MSVEQFVCGKTFYDNINFPRGFGRSGQFTRREAELLEKCGVMIKELASETVQPSCAEHKAMLEVLFGKRQAESELEKLWIKYQNQIHTKIRKISACSGRADTDFSDVSDYSVA